MCKSDGVAADHPDISSLSGRLNERKHSGAAETWVRPGRGDSKENKNCLAIRTERAVDAVDQVVGHGDGGAARGDGPGGEGRPRGLAMAPEGDKGAARDGRGGGFELAELTHKRTESRAQVDTERLCR